MAEWSISIVPTGAASGPQAAFVSRLQPDGVNATTGDVVTWNNETPDTHQPWPADDQFNPLKGVTPSDQNYLSNPIPAKHSSRPSWIVRNLTTNKPPVRFCYVCALHPDEQGVITITS